MPSYFFQVTEGDNTFLASEGMELPDLAAAQQEAVRGASGLIAEAVQNGELHYRGQIKVEDERGRKLLVLEFACPITVETVPPTVLHSV